MLSTKGLVALAGFQQMDWRLIKVENRNYKNYQRHISRIWFYFLMKFTLLQVILTLNNHWLDA